MKFCTNCGTKLHDEARFCSSCGEKQLSTEELNPPKEKAPTELVFNENNEQQQQQASNQKQDGEITTKKKAFYNLNNKKFYYFIYSNPSSYLFIFTCNKHFRGISWC